MFNYLVQTENADAIILPEGYTQRDVFWAAIRVQLASFLSLETENARWLGSPAFRKLETNQIEIQTAAFNSKLTNAFDVLLDNAPRSPQWESSIGMPPSMQLHSFKMQDFAQYLLRLINQFERDLVEFIEADSNIKDKIDVLLPQKQKKLFGAIFVMFNHVMNSPKRFSDHLETIFIHTFCSQIQTCLSSWTYLVKELGFDKKNYVDILRLQAVLLGTVLEGDAYYAKMINESTLQQSRIGTAFMLGCSEEDINIFFENITYRYQLPQECFNINEKWSHAKILLHFMESNYSFLARVRPPGNVPQFSPEIYQTILRRLCENILLDPRLPTWLAEKKDLYANCMLIPISLLKYCNKIFDNISYFIDIYDAGSLENFLKQTFKEFLVGLMEVIKEYYAAFISKNDIITHMQEMCHNLSRLYSRELSLSGKICATLAGRANKFLSDFVNTADEYTTSADFSKILGQEIECIDLEKWMGQKNIELMLSSPLVQLKNLDDAILLISDLLTVRGSIPELVFHEIIGQIFRQYEIALKNEVSASSFSFFSLTKPKHSVPDNVATFLRSEFSSQNEQSSSPTTVRYSH